MNEFVNAFKAGQEAAAKAQADRASIAALVRKLSNELGAATDGRLEIQIRSFDDRVQSPAMVAMSIMESLTNASHVRNDYLAARNPLAKNSEYKRIAKWIQSESGFPCRIIYGKTEVSTHDIESLTNAIEAALSSAYVGEKLVAIVASSDEPPRGNS
jgi:hypothetical protein